MTAASPAAPPPVGDNGVNGHAAGHSMNMPRFHPIAINPNAQSSGPPGTPPYRPYNTSIMDHGPPPSHHAQPHPQQPSGPLPPPPPPPPHHHHQQPPSQQQQPHLAHSAPPPLQQGPPQLPVQIDQIEARLRQIEQEEANRAAARAHTLAVRKREDEEFRMITERAEAEEEDLRRRRKRLKRESMGLTFDGQTESPPAPAPRRLSETSAATTLAFFKQQSPPEPRPPELRPPPPPPPPAIIQQPTPMAPSPIVSVNGTGTFRKKQKYTIKNAEAWGERHGRPATYDPAGRALWKRPSDGQLVYLDCPAPDCGKSDFVTLHGFMCHLTKKHKDRSLGSQSRALDLCGTVYDPNAPRPQRPSRKRGSAEGSRAGSMHTEEAEEEYLSASDNEGSLGPGVVKKEDAISPPLAAEQPNGSMVPPSESPRQQANGNHNNNLSNKASIASMIDSNVRADSWRPTSSPRPPESRNATEPPAAPKEEMTSSTNRVTSNGEIRS